MALIPESNEEQEAAARLRIASWARSTGSSYVCITCGAYVGVRHLLRPRTPTCQLGSARTWTVKVDHTDRHDTYQTTVDVLAETETEATLVAAQMVDAIRHDTIGGMVTRTTVVSCADARKDETT